MPEEEEGGQEGFFWENQSWGFSNSDNSGESKEEPGTEKPRVLINDHTQEVKEKVEKTTHMDNKKRRRGGGSRPKTSSGKDQGNNDHEQGKGNVFETDDHEMHIWTERERRKKMRNMFTSLHALLPQLPSKADKSTIVDEAVNYIKTLEHTLQKLQKQKLERLQSLSAATASFTYDPSQSGGTYDTREAFIADQGSSNNLASTITTNPSYSAPNYPPVMFQTWTSSNMVLNICGDEAQFSVCSSKKPGLFTNICYVLEKHKIEVISAHISSNSNRAMYMIQAHAVGFGALDDPLVQLLPVEELFKQAAGEIMLWLS